MTDFNNLDPKQFRGASFNTNKQGKQPAKDKNITEKDTVPAAPNRTPVDSSKVWELLKQQGQLNLSGVDNVSIANKVQAFTEFISPERFEEIRNQFKSVYQEEFGKQPDADVLDTMVSDFIIGVPVVQA